MALHLKNNCNRLGVCGCTLSGYWFRLPPLEVYPVYRTDAPLSAVD